MPKTIDSLTGKEFNSYEEYLDHVNPVTGYTPRDLQHQGKRGVMVARKALGRTKSLNKEREDELNATYAEVEKGGVDQKLSEQRAEKMQEEKIQRLARSTKMSSDGEVQTRSR